MTGPTTGEIVQQMSRCSDEIGYAISMTHRLHPEVRDDLVRRLDAAREMIRAEAARLTQLAREVTP
ncbi:MAG: hypothetical protein RL885_24875 [Planctomycetota bacterium]